jgi:hypothetical protein
VFGTSPRDWTKIMLLIFAGLVVLAGIIALIAMTRGH